MKTGADCVADELYAHGVRTVFVFTGGAIAAIIDAAHRRGIEVVPYDHELDASYAAEGYVRANALPTAVMVTSGPGATNTISGMAGSWFDSVPVLFISGQVKSFEKTNFDLYLQRGFQEVDVVKSTAHFAKYARAVDHSSEIIPAVREAFQFMTSGRPGPAVLDITMDAQMDTLDSVEADLDRRVSFSDSISTGLLNNIDSRVCRAGFADLFDRMVQARKAVIIVGGGAQWLPQGLFENTVDKLGLTVVSTYAGVNAIKQENPLYLGMIGPFGHPEANSALLEASDIFILGARIPHRAFPIFSEVSALKFQSIRKWVLTLDPGEFINHKIGSVEQVYLGLLHDFCEFVDSKVRDKTSVSKTPDSYESPLPPGMFASRPSEATQNIRREHVFTVEALIDSLNSSLPNNADVFVDVGQNAVALAVGLKRGRGERLFSSWANSPMGYSLPAALGAAIVKNERPSICVIGDGGIRTALSSIPNLRAMIGKIKVILWDNNGYQTIVDHSLKFGQTGNPVNVESGLNYFPLKEILIASEIRVMDTSDDLGTDMKLFFESEHHDVLIVPIDESIGMSANAPI